MKKGPHLFKERAVVKEGTAFVEAGAALVEEGAAFVEGPAAFDEFVEEETAFVKEGAAIVKGETAFVEGPASFVEAGPSMASVSHAANFKHFGPRALPDFAVSVDGRLVPQDFAIDCDAIWGELFSNRVFRVKKLRKKKRQVSSKTKTHFHKLFRAAIRMIRRHANQKGRGGYRSVVNGASVKTMRPGIAGVSQWSDAQRKMVGKHCQLKKMRDDIQRRARGVEWSETNSSKNVQNRI